MHGFEPFAPCSVLVQRFLLRLHGADVKDEAAFDLILSKCWASVVAQLVKNLPTMRETWVQSLGWEDPLEKGMATHSTILAWKFSCTA